MLGRLISSIIASIGGLWIAKEFVHGVIFTGSLEMFLIIGAVLGIINGILKPILNLVTFPIRILTLGLSSLVVSALLVLLVDALFEELDITGIIPLIWTTLAIWGAGSLLSLLTQGKF